ncbi:hypothetical protein PsorP6_007410 [Peronosclerospora sorghi]|uniref:Uncharacterized protein n=1 Tax=Peronosclerospora sorghi TaxID=230839 RepID=A0ACC0W7M6_9STRA|nr:hypothetical protein PsorP6_007410 [Peronosclerospora sorghi]
MTSDDDNSEINSSFTHESVEIQSTKHTVDLEEGEIGDVSKSDDGDVSRQSSVWTNETNKSQEETSVENEAVMEHREMVMKMEMDTLFLENLDQLMEKILNKRSSTTNNMKIQVTEMKVNQVNQ